MEQLFMFAQEKWYLILAAAVVLLIVIKMVKTFVKWVAVLAILAALIGYGSTYMGKIEDISSKVVDYTKDQAVNALIGEAKDAAYHDNGDGTFTIKTKNLQLDGKKGSSEVKVTFKGQSVTLKLDDTLRNFIDNAKKK